jgi:hypothetical protein
MQRRRYLALASGSVSTLGLAGCSDDAGGDGQNNTSGGGTEASGGEPDASTETDAPTETTTEMSDAETTMEADTTMADTETEAIATETTETETETETSTETETEMETTMETETATSTPTPTSQRGFSETFSGSGKSTVEGLELAPGPITAAFSVDSEAYHTFELLTLEGESYEDVRLVSGLFSGEGRQVATVSAGGEHNLNADTEAEWEITIEQPTTPQPESLPIDASGSGMDYVGPFAFDGPTTFQGTHDGESNFIVRAVPVDPSETGSSVFNETEQFDGETTARVEGAAYLNVEADGDWTLSTG